MVEQLIRNSRSEVRPLSPAPPSQEVVRSSRTLFLSNRPVRIGCTVKWVENCSVGVEFAHLNLQDQEELWKFHAKESARQRKSPA